MGIVASTCQGNKQQEVEVYINSNGQKFKTTKHNDRDFDDMDKENLTVHTIHAQVRPEDNFQNYAVPMKSDFVYYSEKNFKSAEKNLKQDYSNTQSSKKR